MFLVSSSVNVSIFHSTWLNTFWTDHIYMERERDWFSIRNWLIWLWGLRKSRICRVGWQAGHPEKPMPQMKSILLENSRLLLGNEFFVPLRPSTDLLSRLIHIMESNVLYSISTSLNVNLIQKHHHKNTQNNVWPNIWAHCSLVKLTHKINPQTPLNLSLLGGRERNRETCIERW